MKEQHTVSKEKIIEAGYDTSTNIETEQKTSKTEQCIRGLKLFLYIQLVFAVAWSTYAFSQSRLRQTTRIAHMDNEKIVDPRTVPFQPAVESKEPAEDSDETFGQHWIEMIRRMNSENVGVLQAGKTLNEEDQIATTVDTLVDPLFSTTQETHTKIEVPQNSISERENFKIKSVTFIDSKHLTELLKILSSKSRNNNFGVSIDNEFESSDEKMRPTDSTMDEITTDSYFNMAPVEVTTTETISSVSTVSGPNDEPPYESKNEKNLWHDFPDEEKSSDSPNVFTDYDKPMFMGDWSSLVSPSSKTELDKEHKLNFDVKMEMFDPDVDSVENFGIIREIVNEEKDETSSKEADDWMMTERKTIFAKTSSDEDNSAYQTMTKDISETQPELASFWASTIGPVSKEDVDSNVSENPSMDEDSGVEFLWVTTGEVAYKIPIVRADAEQTGAEEKEDYETSEDYSSLDDYYSDSEYSDVQDSESSEQPIRMDDNIELLRDVMFVSTPEGLVQAYQMKEDLERVLNHTMRIIVSDDFPESSTDDPSTGAEKRSTRSVEGSNEIPGETGSMQPRLHLREELQRDDRQAIRKAVTELHKKLELLAAHIDRLHVLYLRNNKLNDDYVSQEMSAEILKE